jgi:hypothetical protein
MNAISCNIDPRNFGSFFTTNSPSIEKKLWNLRFVSWQTWSHSDLLYYLSKWFGRRPQLLQRMFRCLDWVFLSHYISCHSDQNIYLAKSSDGFLLLRPQLPLVCQSQLEWKLNFRLTYWLSRVRIPSRACSYQSFMSPTDIAGNDAVFGH